MQKESCKNIQPFSCSNFLNDLGFLKWAWLYHTPLWLRPNIKLAFSNSPYLCRRTEKNWKNLKWFSCSKQKKILWTPYYNIMWICRIISSMMLLIICYQLYVLNCMLYIRFFLMAEDTSTKFSNCMLVLSQLCRSCVVDIRLYAQTFSW